MLNIKIEIKGINVSSFFKEELRINDWIDLIFGYRQWDEKPKKKKNWIYSENIVINKI